MRARIDVDARKAAAVHGGGQRLRSAHAAQARGDDQPARQRAAEVLPGARGEGLVGALQDALGADVDPGAGRHLAVHRQAHALQLGETLPRWPSCGTRLRVGDQHARGVCVRRQHADRLAALHQQRLVVRRAASERSTMASKQSQLRAALPDAAVDDQVVGVLGHLGIEVVHEHPQRRFLDPALAVQLGAAGSTDGFGNIGTFFGQWRLGPARQ